MKKIRGDSIWSWATEWGWVLFRNILQDQVIRRCDGWRRGAWSWFETNVSLVLGLIKRAPTRELTLQFLPNDCRTWIPVCYTFKSNIWSFSHIHVWWFANPWGRSCNKVIFSNHGEDQQQEINSPWTRSLAENSSEPKEFLAEQT